MSLDVSVIIPAYNAADTIGSQLSALLSQDFDGRWEIIVSDNRSTDETASLVRTLSDSNERIRLVEAPGKRNAANARNLGVGASKGKKLLFCDADDEVGHGWVRAMARALDDYDFVVGTCDIKKLNPFIQTWGPYSCTGDGKELNFLPYAITANCGIRRHLFSKTGGFNVRYDRGEDIELSWRLILRGHPLHVVREAIVYHKLRDRDVSAWRQFVAVGLQDVHLYKDFCGYGMPRDSLIAVLQKYRWGFRHMAYLFSNDWQRRRLWILTMGRSWGRLIGTGRWMMCFL